MNQDTFVSRHEQTWQQFEAWLESGSSKHAGQVAIEEMQIDVPHLYRQICHHLSLARERRYSAHVVERLNDLVLQGHQRLYSARRVGMHQFNHFLFVGFPRRVRREWRLLLLSALLFYVPMVGMFFAAQVKPEIVYSVMSPGQIGQMESMYAPEAKKLGRDMRERGSADDIMMFGFYIRNNIGIGFQTFAGGLLFTLGSIFFLVFNGLHIGTAAGHLTQIGSTTPFFSFVAGHSALELTAIVLSGTAGMRLGIALLKPGRLTRLQALKIAGRQSVPLVYGAALMLVGAAFVEAFWSSTKVIEPAVKYTVGIVFWVLVLGYFLFAGVGRED